MMHSVSFTTNVCVADVEFAEQTIRHMIRSLNYPFKEKHIVIDTGALSGKYLARPAGQVERLRERMNVLLEDGTVDALFEIPWDESTEVLIRNHYLKNTQGSLRDRDGAPIFQYLYALYQCSGDYILHADSDMLFFSGSRQRHWIDEAIDLMESRPEVVSATQVNGPPRAENVLERLLKRKLPPMRKREWAKPRIISTRCFLMHAQRLHDGLIPLMEGESGQPLEDMFSFTAEQRGFTWLSLCSDDPRDPWWLHPMRRDDTFAKNVDTIIRMVEAGAYPIKRWGERYNLYTYGIDWPFWEKVVNKNADIF